MASLVKQIDRKIGQNGSLKSFVVVLTDDADKTADTLKKLAADAGIKNVPLTVVESPAGPPAYEIAEDADVTVLMWKGTKVQANRAYKGKLTDKEIQAVLDDLPKILDSK